jgi:hypothetical protein
VKGAAQAAPFLFSLLSDGKLVPNHDKFCHQLGYTRDRAQVVDPVSYCVCNELRRNKTHLSVRALGPESASVLREITIPGSAQRKQVQKAYVQ